MKQKSGPIYIWYILIYVNKLSKAFVSENICDPWSKDFAEA